MVCSRLDIAIYRTRDMNLIKRLASHPAIYPHIIDDGCPQNSADWHPHDGDKRYYLIPYNCSDDCPKPMGLIAYYPINHILFDAHIFIYPEYQARLTVALGHKANRWLFENTSAQKIMAFVPINKLAVLKLVQRVGFAQEGFLKKSFLLKGQLTDQYIYALEKNYYGYGQ